MTLNINVPQPTLLKPKISVFGVGGAGGNAINNMIKSNLEGVEFIAANTDAQALSNSLASERIQLGVHFTKGLGAGSIPDHGRTAAEENIEDIVKYLEDNNMVFITAGMGGGTGTGAAPVIAKLAKERDILTVGVVTKPFDFEGHYRMEIAEAGIEELKKYVDTLIIIPNQNLFRIANEQTTFESAFRMADDILHAGVRGVTDLITMPGLVNLDFADIRTIMTKMGKAMMGTGEAEGEDRAIHACQAAVSNPLLDDISIRGAKGVLVNMTGGPDMTLFEADIAVNTIRKEVDPGANIIFGSAFNEDMKGKIRVSVVATGIEDDDHIAEERSNDTGNIRNVNSVEWQQGKKTFFDPGVIKNPEQNLQAVEEEGFESHKILNDITKSKIVRSSIGNFNREEEKVRNYHVLNRQEINDFDDYDQDTNYNNEKPNNEYYSDDSGLFRDQDSFSRVEEQIAGLEEVIEEEKQLKGGRKPKPKKEGGFSLFNFMNHSKSDKANENKKSLEEQEKKTINIKEGNKQDRGFDVNVQNKVDQTPEPGDFTLEDDILNIPAFFRRKK